MVSSADSIRNALWTATVREPAVAADTFEAGREVDVAIVGGGFTGLSAALAATTRGATVALCEARTIGWGASGRNGGQVIPGLKLDPSEMRAAYGATIGDRLVKAVGDAADSVFDLIKQHRIDCEPKRAGWIQAAHAVLNERDDWTLLHVARHDPSPVWIAPHLPSAESFTRADVVTPLELDA